MKLKPLNDRLLIEKIPAEEVTRGGIFIPDTARERPVRGKILAKGPGRWKADASARIPITPEEGQTVMFAKHNAGLEIKDDEGRELLVVKEEDILLIEG